jgi:hypothetical protein
MAHLLIGIGKLLLSKDLWNRARDLMRFATRPSSWNNAITLRAKIKKRDRGLAKQFAGSVRTRMKAFGFHDGNINDFMAAFHELVDNGFSHGCKSETDSISLRVIIFDHGAIGEVRNENRSCKVPDLDKLVQREPEGAMGRGLRRVCATADYYNMTAGGRGVMFYLHRYAEYHNSSDQNITIINIGGYSKDVVRKISQSLHGKSGDVILVFSDESPPSASVRAAEMVATSDDVRHFAIVSRYSNLDEVWSPKLFGCFENIKDAVAVLRPDVPDVVKASSDLVVRKPSRKPRGARVVTAAHARIRIEDTGYTNVSGLKVDDEGVWCGRAQKDGTQVSVWVNNKGAVAESYEREWAHLSEVDVAVRARGASTPRRA